MCPREELPGLPSSRGIEFEIELLPRTKPISKAPYQMAPAELKGVKTAIARIVGQEVYSF